MDSNVRIKRTVYNKAEHQKVIDRTFKSFVPQLPSESISVEDFFALYEDLYYVIPAQGEELSHSYLIQRSSELVSVEQTSIDIQPLLDEIASLREQLLEANQALLDLQLEQAQQA